ncbi:ACT domain-containing protein [Oleisolibacter albus]|uniref:ACT domain-containing protein n=1 Tax=Oleisolibacter albus TaxID=2171757 RepID=UPI000DF2AF50|nr:ACT domain-containing protein [Oleisolibacter albus]
MPHYSLTLLPDRLAVCRLPPNSLAPDSLAPGGALPAWIAGAMRAPGFLSLTRTADELSLICAAEHVPGGGAVDFRVVAGWRILRVDGPFDFGVTGVMAALSGALSAAGISLLPLATFDTDYLLLRETDLDRAVTALVHAGHAVQGQTGLA